VDWRELKRHEEAERGKLREMFDFAYHEHCLRKFILRYFGDQKRSPAAAARIVNRTPMYRRASPGELTVKRKPKKKPPWQVELPPPVPLGPRVLSKAEHLAVRKILSCIARLDGKFGKGHSGRVCCAGQRPRAFCSINSIKSQPTGC
jgi:hypothetical protein